MKFSDYYFQRFICGLEPGRLEQVLRNADEEISARPTDNGSLYLSNHKIIKCVRYYYERADDDHSYQQTRSQNNYLQCQATRDAFGGSSIGKMECRECHLNCLRLLRQGNLKRKKGKNSK